MIESITDEKYLYLTEVSWVDAWVKGGVIPLNLASTYRSVERRGIYTPDENIVRESSHDLRELPPQIKLNSSHGKIGRLHVSVGRPSTPVDDQVNIQWDHVEYKHKEEDGLILSLCNHVSMKTAKKFNKKACVRINNVGLLKFYLDRMVGVFGEAKNCQYTDSYNRGHFLKSSEDKWQDEYRIFWRFDQNAEVELPRGIAKQVNLRKYP